MIKFDKEQHWTKRGNWLALLLAFIVSAVLIGWQTYAERQYERQMLAERIAEPAETWLYIRNVAVPDHIEGENPVITYDRDIRRNVRASWVAEVHSVTPEGLFLTCTGNGTNSYKVNERLPEAGVSLEWFMGKNCDLKAGRYIIETEWFLHIDGYPEKVTSFVSNPFSVLPRGAQLYITPEQVEKLEAQ